MLPKQSNKDGIVTHNTRLSVVDETWSGSIKRKTILIAAYDAGMRNSEGYVAWSLIEQLDRQTRVILVTRRNNVAELRASPEFITAHPNVHLVGFDLPKWATWWKKGPRGYGLYAYLWQMSWPFVVKQRRWLIGRLTIVHTLNFHNDSIPNMGWILGRPSVWGPINHNEGTPRWRMVNWPAKLRWRNAAKSFLRVLAWRLDPFLALATAKSTIILSAGSWVDRRLKLDGCTNVRRRSQLGLDISLLPLHQTHPPGGFRLISGGRLDWIKGLDLALVALAQLPDVVTLTIIGDGPCKDFLVERSVNLGIAHRVTFQPAVPRAQLLRYYSDHDIFLFPSAEAGGLAWVEALAAGLPVVGLEGPTELSEMAQHLPGIRLVKDMESFEKNASAFAAEIVATASLHIDRKIISVAAQKYYSWDRFATDVKRAYMAASGAKV